MKHSLELVVGSIGFFGLGEACDTSIFCRDATRSRFIFDGGAECYDSPLRRQANSVVEIRMIDGARRRKYVRSLDWHKLTPPEGSLPQESSALRRVSVGN